MPTSYNNNRLINFASKIDENTIDQAIETAGRQYSRTKARELFTLEDLERAMEGIEYCHGEAWIDEIPQSYKSIDIVMEDAKDLVEIEYELRQILNVKGT